MDSELGWRFWVGLIGAIVGVSIGGFLFFTLITVTWIAWGAFAALVIAIGLIFGVTYAADHLRTH